VAAIKFVVEPNKLPPAASCGACPNVKLGTVVVPKPEAKLKALAAGF
jgi:hypothetical protein